MNTKALIRPEYMVTLKRMIIMGICTFILGVIVNQFISHGIRLPVLIKSLPIFAFSKIHHISQEDALTLLNEKKAAFVDTREELEFDMDHIVGAVSIPVLDFLSNPKLVDSFKSDPSLTAIVYGAKGEIIHEPMLGRFLKKKGVKEVKVLHGGFELWTENDYPVDF